MALVKCGECGKCRDDVVCKDCYDSVVAEKEQLEDENLALQDELDKYKTDLAILQELVARCQNCQTCIAIKKMEGGHA